MVQSDPRKSTSHQLIVSIGGLVYETGEGVRNPTADVGVVYRTVRVHSMERNAKEAVPVHAADRLVNWLGGSNHGGKFRGLNG